MVYITQGNKQAISEIQRYIAKKTVDHIQSVQFVIEMQSTNLKF